MSFLKVVFQGALTFAFVILAFNTGQLQSYFYIDYVNYVCGGPAPHFSNPNEFDIGKILIGNFTRSNFTKEAEDRLAAGPPRINASIFPQN